MFWKLTFFFWTLLSHLNCYSVLFYHRFKNGKQNVGTSRLAYSDISLRTIWKNQNKTFSQFLICRTRRKIATSFFTSKNINAQKFQFEGNSIYLSRTRRTTAHTLACVALNALASTHNARNHRTAATLPTRARRSTYKPTRSHARKHTLTRGHAPLI